MRRAEEETVGGALCLFLSESFCFLDGKEEFLFELLEAFVRGQVQTVEAVDTRIHPRISLRTIMLNPFTSQWNQSHLICLMSAKYYLFPTTVSFFKTSFFPLSLSLHHLLYHRFSPTYHMWVWNISTAKNGGSLSFVVFLFGGVS